MMFSWSSFFNSLISRKIWRGNYRGTEQFRWLYNMLANHKRNINSFVEIIKLTPSLPSSSFIFLSAALSPVIISTASNTSLRFVGKRHGSDRLGVTKIIHAYIIAKALPASSLMVMKYNLRKGWWIIPFILFSHQQMILGIRKNTKTRKLAFLFQRAFKTQWEIIIAHLIQWEQDSRKGYRLLLVQKYYLMAPFSECYKFLKKFSFCIFIHLYISHQCILMFAIEVLASNTHYRYRKKKK